ENLARLAYAGADFTLMPSLFEPCGLPQMIGALYGSLPIIHNTGGLRDTVSHLDVSADSGNGFVFNDYDSGALLWAIDEAVGFHKLPAETKDAQLTRVMLDAALRFNHGAVAESYMAIYEKMLDRPLFG
ncbi:MAG: glycogen synthase, partial [Kiritimatiellaeota bacterium]|nr:glycogen synthase [Kiritimatiellota bacterium]